MENFVLVKNYELAIIGPCNGPIEDTLKHLESALLGHDGYSVRIIWGKIKESLDIERELLMKLKIIVMIYNELT